MTAATAAGAPLGSGQPAPLTVVDLFAGAGGLSQGFRQAGFRVLAGSDHDPDAMATYAANFPGARALCGDVRDPAVREQLDELEAGADVLVGGPPCQAFSQVRNHTRLIDDPRNSLYREFVLSVATARPAAFLMENVPGMAQMGVKSQVLADLRQDGEYLVEAQLVDAADFGVPQTRKRLLFLGVRADLGVDPPLLAGTGATAGLQLVRFASESTAGGAATGYAVTARPDLDGEALALRLADAGDLGVTSVAQAISDLSVLEAGRREEVLRPQDLPPAASAYQQLMRAGSAGAMNVSVPRLREDTALRLAGIPAGGNHRDLPEHLRARYLTGDKWGPSNGSGRLGRAHYYAYRRLHPGSVGVDAEHQGRLRLPLPRRPLPVRAGVRPPAVLSRPVRHRHGPPPGIDHRAHRRRRRPLPLPPGRQRRPPVAGRTRRHSPARRRARRPYRASRPGRPGRADAAPGGHPRGVSTEDGLPADPATGEEVPTIAVDRPFGTDNRARLLHAHFDAAAPVTVDLAWTHVYRLLLWVDRTTGLAHCYESDKSQPGRPWYARSLAFHAWVSDELDVPAGDLGEHIDLLFRRATADLATAAAARRSLRDTAAGTQRAPYAGRGLPLPGEDPELEAIVTDTLAPHLSSQPPADVLRALTERIQAHVGQENKRKNLVGEGFEDTLAAVLARIPAVAGAHDILVRPWLHDLPGFNRPRGNEKPRQVDLALVRRSDQMRTLVSCKWSVRSDREEQFASDFRSYSDLEALGEDFDYVLVTNEFDPARLAAACDMRRQNAQLFTDVVHVNPGGPTAAYAAPGLPARSAAGGQAKALERIETGRLTGLAAWIRGLGKLSTDMATLTARQPGRPRTAERTRRSSSAPASTASSPGVRSRMQVQRTRDTAPELALRRLLHAAGLRYRVDRPPLPGLRRRADLVFGPARVAVYVDGCFWHGCPQHGTRPKANTDWWDAKLAGNRARDADTDRRLTDAGWFSDAGVGARGT